MRRPRTSPAEQYRLVMECRQSGLSDARWCEENDIQRLLSQRMLQ